MDASLVMFKADGTRREFPLRKDRVVVGRTNSCDLRIPLSSVSRQHCELLVEGDHIRLRDLGSSNGTYHNSNRVHEAVLGPGDEVSIGPVVFTLVIDGQPAEIEPAKAHPLQQAAERAGSSSSVDIPAVNKPKPKAEKLPLNDSSEMPDVSSGEQYSPTVDLDDPIAALEAMSEVEDSELPSLSDDEEKKKRKDDK